MRRQLAKLVTMGLEAFGIDHALSPRRKIGDNTRPFPATASHQERP